MSALVLSGTRRRLERFSDAAFAVILVVSVASVRLPAASGEQSLTRMLSGAGPQLLACLLVAFTIGVLWINHTRLMEAAPSDDRMVIWLNIAVLIGAALLPVGAFGMSANAYSAGSVALYGMILTLLAVTMICLRLYFWTRPERDSALTALHARIAYRVIAAFLIAAGSIPLSGINVWAAVVCFFLAPAVFLLPEAGASAPEPRS